MKRSAHHDFSVYVVTDPMLSRGRRHDEVASAAFAGGANVVQLRDKHASSQALYNVASKMQALASKSDGIFIVNDRVELVQAVDADGLHLGQDDLSVAAARKMLGKKKVIGVSVESGEQAAEAERDGATYVAIGPIYEARGSKSDAGPPVGPQAIAEIRAHTSLPIIAIGGIKHHHVAEVVTAGANGLAIVSAIVSAPDIRASTAELRRLIEAARFEAARTKNPARTNETA